MNEEPIPDLVSTVIPTYNVEEYVGTAIESVLQQDYPRVEVIVVDDGSSDATVGRVRDYSESDAPVRLIEQPHRGANAARNDGLEKSRGEFVQFLDADDWLAERKFSIQTSWLAANDGAGMVFSDHRRVDPSGDVRDTATMDIPVQRESFLLALLAGVGCPHTNSLLFRREVFCNKDIEWDERLSAAQEWDLQMQIAYEGVRVSYCPLTLSVRRERGSGNIWSSPEEEILCAQEEALRKWTDRLKHSDEARQAAAQSYFRLARRARQAGLITMSDRFLHEVFELDTDFVVKEDSLLFNLIGKFAGVKAALWIAQAKRRLTGEST